MAQVEYLITHVFGSLDFASDPFPLHSRTAGGPLMFTLEVPFHHCCQCCDSVLETAPEYECSEWFLRCVSCGAKNLFVLTLRFIGWRPAESDLGYLKALPHPTPNIEVTQLSFR